jgi:hypothetical protein
MFADSDLQFNEEEFTNGSVYNNSNTRDKLVRIDDSIRRGIDFFYDNTKPQVKFVKNIPLKVVDDIYINELDLSDVADIDCPSRIDLRFNDTSYYYFQKNDIEFIYDRETQTVSLTDDYINFEDEAQFVVWYNASRENIPDGVDPLTYNLDSLNIPNNVQRMLPYFVKSELYEEDEPNVAQLARSQFIQFIYSLRRQQVYTQKKVKHSAVFDQRN